MNEKHFKFFDDGEDSSLSPSDSLCVVINEDLDHAANDNYGCYTWISAPVLAHYVWRHRRRVKGRHVIEIGAGPSLPGIVAGHCGAASLTLADSRVFHPAALRLARRNADLNGLPEARVIDVTWGLIGPELPQSPAFDFVLASDCFYDTHQFEEVIFTVANLLREKTVANQDDQQQQQQHLPLATLQHPEAWISYQERSSGRSIRHLLSKYELRCVEEIHWDDFYDSAGSERERNSLNLLHDHHQISSVWILLVRMSG